MYDLKGSTYKREVEKYQIENYPLMVRKDLNFKTEERWLHLTKRKIFLTNVKEDSEFLEDLNLMDYSLLVIKMEFDEEIISKFLAFKETKDFKYYRRHVYYSSSQRNVVYICIIIDYLQDYTLIKLLESQFNGYSKDVSCVNAADYCQRFKDFFQEITEEVDSDKVVLI